MATEDANVHPCSLLFDLPPGHGFPSLVLAGVKCWDQEYAACGMAVRMMLEVCANHRSWLAYSCPNLPLWAGLETRSHANLAEIPFPLD